MYCMYGSGVKSNGNNLYNYLIMMYEDGLLENITSGIDWDDIKRDVFGRNWCVLDEK